MNLKRKKNPFCYNIPVDCIFNDTKISLALTLFLSAVFTPKNGKSEFQIYTSLLRHSIFSLILQSKQPSFQKNKNLKKLSIFRKQYSFYFLAIPHSVMKERKPLYIKPVLAATPNFLHRRNYPLWPLVSNDYLSDHSGRHI
eukprot:TRINITY_DN3579_c0_g1_i1.p1 TRINITY_DN3579_c0_g1~~TRINITY_DN3579_c0_g1_i1.p1  ORF type:complete len:141 (+),score=0.16 TRINITY_DN3579_c0_g1_i1:933-1355(+)